ACADAARGAGAGIAVGGLALLADAAVVAAAVAVIIDVVAAQLGVRGGLPGALRAPLGDACADLAGCEAIAAGTDAARCGRAGLAGLRLVAGAGAVVVELAVAVLVDVVAAQLRRGCRLANAVFAPFGDAVVQLTRDGAVVARAHALGLARAGVAGRGVV